MIHVTLTLKNGDQQALDIPFKIEDVLQRSMPYYLAYGQASIEFDTPNQQLNEKLNHCGAEPIESSVQELAVLAHALERMEPQRLELLCANFPDEPYDYSELIGCTLYYSECELTDDGTPKASAVMPDWYRKPWEHSDLAEKVQRKFRKELDAQRLTAGQLFEKVIDRAKENGDLARFDAINEYILPSDYEAGKLCSYEFDFLPAVNFGGSEGIYIDCSLRGKFDDSGRQSIQSGTIKTLSTDLDACKIMGELCGVLLYHESAFVNENLYLFESTESIDKMLSRKFAVSPQQSMTEQQETMGGLTMG